MDINNDFDKIPVTVFQGVKTVNIYGNKLLRRQFIKLFDNAKNLKELNVSTDNYEVDLCMFDELCSR